MKCPFFDSPQKKDPKKAVKYDLNDATERGKYLHNFIANNYDPSIPFLRQSSYHNKKAEDAIAWANKILTPEEPTQVESLMQKELSIYDGALTISARPDIYQIVNNKLIVIDFKFSNNAYFSYIDQIIFYAGMIAEMNEEIEDVELYIKFLGTKVTSIKYDRQTLIQLYEQLLNNIIKFYETAQRTPCDKCDTCTRKTCIAKLKAAAEDILEMCEDEEHYNLDLSNDGLKNTIYSILCIQQSQGDAKDAVPTEKTKSFQSTEEAVELYIKECEKQGRKPNYTTKRSVSSNEFKEVMGEEIHQLFCTKESTPTINDIAKPLCKF